MVRLKKSIHEEEGEEGGGGQEGEEWKEKEVNLAQVARASRWIVKNPRAPPRPPEDELLAEAARSMLPALPSRRWIQQSRRRRCRLLEIAVALPAARDRVDPTELPPRPESEPGFRGIRRHEQALLLPAAIRAKGGTENSAKRPAAVAVAVVAIGEGKGEGKKCQRGRGVANRVRWC